MRVTALVPVHNGASTIERAVRSALDQSHDDLEVIVVDDGSTDSTVEILHAVAEGDGRVRLLSNPNGPSGEPTVPRNIGLAASTGDVVALLDADDRWLPNKLELQLAELTATSADVVYSRAWVEEAGVERCVDFHERWGLCPWPRLPTGQIAQQVAIHNVVPTCTGVVRRKAIDAMGGFELGLPGVEDWYLWLRLAFSGSRFAAIEDHLAVYAWHPHNFSRSNAFAMARARVEAVARIGDLHPQQRSLLRRPLKTQQQHLADLELREILDGRRSVGERLHLLGSAVRHRPSGRAWTNLARNVAPARRRRLRGGAWRKG